MSITSTAGPPESPRTIRRRRTIHTRSPQGGTACGAGSDAINHGSIPARADGSVGLQDARRTEEAAGGKQARAARSRTSRAVSAPKTIRTTMLLPGVATGAVIKALQRRAHRPTAAPSSRRAHTVTAVRAWRRRGREGSPRGPGSPALLVGTERADPSGRQRRRVAGPKPGPTRTWVGDRSRPHHAIPHARVAAAPRRGRAHRAACSHPRGP